MTTAPGHQTGTLRIGGAMAFLAAVSSRAEAVNEVAGTYSRMAADLAALIDAEAEHSARAAAVLTTALHGLDDVLTALAEVERAAAVRATALRELHEALTALGEDVPGLQENRTPSTILTVTDRPQCPECERTDTYWVYSAAEGNRWACRCGHEWTIHIEFPAVTR